jgi:photosystem II stability/assembly factor-like uncharacterized protein
LRSFSQNFFYLYIFLIVDTFLVLFTINVSNSTPSNDLWIRQTSNLNIPFNRVYFTDTLNGWIAGDSGIILHTSNGGNQWIIQNTNTDFNIYDIRFLNSYTGWAIAFSIFGWPNSILLKTTNSGVNWTKYMFSDSLTYLFTIDFLNETTGWACGHLGVIFKTTNGGSNWFRQFDTSQFLYNSINRIKIYSERNVLACGGMVDLSGVLWKLSNTGNFWSGQGVAGEPLYDIAFLDSNNIFCVGGDIEYGMIIIKSTDSGFSWEYNPVYFFGIGKSISFRTYNEAWVPLSFARTFAITTNTGSNWQEIPTPDTSTLSDIQFVDENHGWAVGLYGTIFKYNKFVNEINIITDEIINNNILYQNFPNPFNASTTIEYNISKKSNVKIKLYNIEGKEIKLLFNNIQNPGIHKIKFSAENIPTGIYIYVIEANNDMQAKKMIILK